MTTRFAFMPSMSRVTSASFVVSPQSIRCFPSNQTSPVFTNGLIASGSISHSSCFHHLTRRNHILAIIAIEFPPRGSPSFSPESADGKALLGWRFWPSWLSRSCFVSECRCRFCLPYSRYSIAPKNASPNLVVSIIGTL